MIVRIVINNKGGTMFQLLTFFDGMGVQNSIVNNQSVCSIRFSHK